MHNEKLIGAFQIGNTYHWPPDGEIRPWTEFWITTFTRPVNGTQSAGVLFSQDGGTNWRHQPMERTCVLGDQEVWHVNLGSFAAGTRIRYAVEGVDPQGASFWDNNGGKDFHALIGSARDTQVSS